MKPTPTEPLRYTPTLDPNLLTYRHVHWEDNGLHLVRLLPNEPIVTVTDYREPGVRGTPSYVTTVVLPA